MYTVVRENTFDDHGEVSSRRSENKFDNIKDAESFMLCEAYEIGWECREEGIPVKNSKRREQNGTVIYKSLIFEDGAIEWWINEFYHRI